jgi:hypothetical protein
MHNTTDYYIEQLDQERLKDLSVLHNAVYDRTPAPDFFERKYATAFTGKQYIGFIAYNNNKEPIGYYGVLPCFLRYNGEKLLAAQSGDTMTHPGFRFKGLFVELANRCYDLCSNQGIKLIFGFPNQHSYHGAVNKLGWQLAGQMDCFTIPVSAFPLAKIAAKTAITRRLFQRYSQGILKHYATTAFPNTIDQDGFDGVWRDKDYMNYKTYHSHHLIRAGAALYWIKLQDTLVIGDMGLGEESDFDHAIGELKQIAARLGFRQIQYHTSRGTKMHRLFAEKCIPMSSFPVLFRDLGFGQPLGRFQFSFADIDIF